MSGMQNPKIKTPLRSSRKTLSWADEQSDDDYDVTEPEISKASSMKPSTSTLLEAIRNLSVQMESLQMQHNDLKNRFKHHRSTRHSQHYFLPSKRNHLLRSTSHAGQVTHRYMIHCSKRRLRVSTLTFLTYCPPLAHFLQPSGLPPRLTCPQLMAIQVLLT